MFQDLDGTLTRLLNDAPQLELPELRGADISFETPDRNFAPAQATVDLFLYEVRENRTLRDPSPVVERRGDTYLRRPAPVRVDCNYVLTTWAAAVIGPVRVAAEHQLLGQALTWLSRFPTIPTRYLQGSLLSPLRIYPLPAMVAQLDPDQHAGEFWTAMGIPPRPAFYLTVTTELALAPPTEGPLVTTTTTRYRRLGGPEPDEGEEWINFGGVVRDGAGAPVVGAWVRLEPAGRIEVTDAEGRYVFTEVRRAAGLTLHGRAVGQTDVSRGVDVPSRTGEYDLQFP